MRAGIVVFSEWCHLCLSFFATLGSTGIRDFQELLQVDTDSLWHHVKWRLSLMMMNPVALFFTSVYLSLFPPFNESFYTLCPFLSPSFLSLPAPLPAASSLCGLGHHVLLICPFPQWAFGVSLWELMTLGQTPYVDIDPFEMAAYLKDGYRIAQPINCPDEL